MLTAKTPFKKYICSAGMIFTLLAGIPASAQFLTAAQVKPILNATKGNWIAVREYNGQDLLYFTHILSWRCGLSGMRYGVNTDTPDKDWDIGACDEETANPNSLNPDQLIYTGFDLQSIQSVVIELTYDDGSIETEHFQRKAILIP